MVEVLAAQASSSATLTVILEVPQHTASIAGVPVVENEFATVGGLEPGAQHAIDKITFGIIVLDILSSDGGVGHVGNLTKSLTVKGGNDEVVPLRKFGLI